MSGTRNYPRVLISLLLLYLPLVASVLDLLPTFHWLLEINRTLSLYRVTAHILALFWLIYIRHDFTKSIFVSLILASLLLSFPTFSTVLSFYKKPEVVEAQTGVAKVRILYANVYSLNKRYSDFRAFVEQREPDIVAIVEYSKNWHAGLNIGGLYPYQTLFPEGEDYGLALFSKFPFSMHHDGDVGEDLPKVIWVNVQTPPGPSFNLTLLHAFPPVNTENFMGRKMLLKRVATRVRHIDQTQIVAGDFNSTPFAFTYQMFVNENGLKNAMQGYGFLSTWRAGIFRFPIDHVLYRGNAKVTDFQRLKDFGSDHYALLVDFDIW